MAVIRDIHGNPIKPNQSKKGQNSQQPKNRTQKPASNIKGNVGKIALITSIIGVVGILTWLSIAHTVDTYDKVKNYSGEQLAIAMQYAENNGGIINSQILNESYNQNYKNIKNVSISTTSADGQYYQFSVNYKLNGKNESVTIAVDANMYEQLSQDAKTLLEKIQKDGYASDIYAFVSKYGKYITENPESIKIDGIITNVADIELGKEITTSSAYYLLQTAVTGRVPDDAVFDEKTKELFVKEFGLYNHTVDMNGFNKSLNDAITAIKKANDGTDLVDLLIVFNKSGCANNLWDSLSEEGKKLVASTNGTSVEKIEELKNSGKYDEFFSAVSRVGEIAEKTTNGEYQIVSPVSYHKTSEIEHDENGNTIVEPVKENGTIDDLYDQITVGGIIYKKTENGQIVKISGEDKTSLETTYVYTDASGESVYPVQNESGKYTLYEPKRGRALNESKLIVISNGNCYVFETTSGISDADAAVSGYLKTGKCETITLVSTTKIKTSKTKVNKIDAGKFAKEFFIPSSIATTDPFIASIISGDNDLDQLTAASAMASYLMPEYDVRQSTAISLGDRYRQQEYGTPNFIAPNRANSSEINKQAQLVLNRTNNKLNLTTGHGFNPGIGRRKV